MRRAYLFQDFDSAAVARLVLESREVELGSDQLLCLRGDTATEYFLVMEGQLALLRQSEDGEEFVVAFVEEGELFAEELAIAVEARHPLSARALQPTRVAALDRRLLRTMLGERPSLAQSMLETLARRNEILLDEIEKVTVLSARDRLLEFVRGRTAGNVEHRPLSKQTIASKLAIRPETLSRVVRELKECRLLHEVGGCLLPLEPAVGGPVAPCPACPLAVWGCPGPRLDSPEESRSTRVEARRP